MSHVGCLEALTSIMPKMRYQWHMASTRDVGMLSPTRDIGMLSPTTHMLANANYPESLMQSSGYNEPAVVASYSCDLYNL